jgi:hypothetical protein
MENEISLTCIASHSFLLRKHELLKMRACDALSAQPQDSLMCSPFDKKEKGTRKQSSAR